MPRNDPLFKDLFQAFFPDLIALVAPEIAEHLLLDQRRFIDKEVFSDLPEGDRGELDLLAEVPARDGPDELILVHGEIEGEHRAEMAQRMWRYYRQVRLRHPEEPVLPIVIYLRGGPAGVRWNLLRDAVLNREISTFRYLSLGLSAASAEDYLARPEALAWGLAALMRWPGGDKVAHKLACLEPVAQAELNELDRFRLVNIIETYIELDDHDADRWADALADAPEEVTLMKVSWADKIKAEGRAEGKAEGRAEGKAEGRAEGKAEGRAEGFRAALRRYLERRFGSLPDAITRRLDSIDDADTLERLSDRAFDGASLDELGLA